MKKECAHTRKSLPKYLRGHLFKLEQLRIERHLRSCVVCYSQYDALKRAAETKQYLKDITPPEGVVQIVKESVSGLGNLKKLLYRPLWIAGIVLLVAAIAYYVHKPRQQDVELENIVKTSPTGTASTVPAKAPAQPAAHPVVAEPTTNVQPVAPVSVAPLIVDPLAISITIDDDKASLRRINGIMAGHGTLRKFKFTDTVREISGSLTTKEMRTFFNRVSSFGKVSYNQKRFKSLPSAHQIPFVVKLTIEPKAPEASAPVAQPAQKPIEAVAPPVPTPVPAQEQPKPVAAPTPSPAR
jgi:hypothetical protein